MIDAYIIWHQSVIDSFNGLTPYVYKKCRIRDPSHSEESPGGLPGSVTCVEVVWRLGFFFVRGFGMGRVASQPVNMVLYLDYHRSFT
ncbi:unnamed protein product [Cercopithifilaria johnstoni]|uniref:Uncharacterized protein n=1 Tax=Cercopithifilaria johnstoni TaxID=2874296 RepID=A0A8J2M2V2_9BILA|nr:unnamed protein product [Cercopithifilaria johnstoni]